MRSFISGLQDFVFDFEATGKGIYRRIVRSILNNRKESF